MPAEALTRGKLTCYRACLASIKASGIKHLQQRINQGQGPIISALWKEAEKSEVQIRGHFPYKASSKPALTT